MLTAASAALILNAEIAGSNANQENTKMDALQLTQEWDKTFPKSEKFDHAKVSFRNRYGITLTVVGTIPHAETQRGGGCRGEEE